MQGLIAEPAHYCPRPVKLFKAYYADLMQADFDSLAQIYDARIRFCDPVHAVVGLDQLQCYMEALCEQLQHCHFEYLDELIGNGQAYIKWNMYFSHRKLGAETICVRGMSQILFDERITYHEDVYDMGAMLYENLPLLGPVTRLLKRRLAG